MAVSSVPPMRELDPAPPSSSSTIWTLSRKRLVVESNSSLYSHRRVSTAADVRLAVTYESCDSVNLYCLP